MLGPFLLLMFGSLCASQAVIIINLSQMPPAALAGWRCIFAALLLSPAYGLVAKRYPRHAGWVSLRKTGLPGVLLGAHLVTWTIGSRLTPIPNAMLIIHMVPLIMPVVLFTLIRERVKRNELIGSAIAFAGILVLTGQGFTTGLSTLRGDLFCFVSMLGYCYYMVFARRNRDIPSIWLYVPPMYLIAGITSLFVAAMLGDWWSVWDKNELALVICLTVIPTIIGHSVLNLAMRQLRGQVVAVGNLSQVGYATLVAWLVFQQVPEPVFYVTLVLLVIGMVITLSGQRQRIRGEVAKP
jgi:drug/metabolite transporter (DMT)-like permease